MILTIFPGVMQYYTDTNAPASIFYINAEGIKPNWNLVIPNYEIQSNKALEGHNNPDPTAVISGAKVKINEYAPANN